MLLAHIHLLRDKVPSVGHDDGESVSARLRPVPSPGEADDVRLVEVLVLYAVGPVSAGDEELGEEGAACHGWNGRIVRGMGGLVLAEGAVEVGVEDAGEAGVGAEEDEGVGEGEEERGDGGFEGLAFLLGGGC